MEAKTKTKNRKAGPRRPAVVDDAPAGGVGLSTLNPQPSTVVPLRGRPPHLAVVDDNPAVHAAVREHLQQAGEPWQVSGYCNGAAALKALAVAPPQAVLMELTLPDGCGLEWAGRLKSRHPELPVVIHTTKGCPEKLFQALSMQAMGYVVKQNGQADWSTHLRKALAGRFAMCEETERLLPQMLTRLGEGNPWGLTPREQEVMLWLCRNKDEKEISTRMKLTINTVHVHLKHAYKKLGVHNRRQAVEEYLPMIYRGG